jgi:hypothetical protein
LINIISTRATIAIPATPPTIPPMTEEVVGSRAPDVGLELVDVLVGAGLAVAPAPAPTPAVPSATPSIETVGTSVLQVRPDEELEVKKLNEELVFERNAVEVVFGNKWTLVLL